MEFELFPICAIRTISAFPPKYTIQTIKCSPSEMVWAACLEEAGEQLQRSVLGCRKL